MSFEQKRNADGTFGEKLGSAPSVELEDAAPATGRPLMPTITRPWNEPHARAAQEAAEREAAQKVAEVPQPETVGRKVSSAWNRLFGTGR